MTNINVTKRSGSKEALDLEKMHNVVAEACKDISGVSPSQVEMNSGLQMYDGVSTQDIQAILIRSAADLISLENPNYQYVAARLMLFDLVKRVFDEYKYPPLGDLIHSCVQLGVYDPIIEQAYTAEDMEKIDKMIDHGRDLTFTYAGLRQVIDKYLVQDRINHVIYETPQFMYMLIAMTIFKNYEGEERLRYVKDFYDATSTFKISLPTPIIAGVRTILRQYSSCVLIDCDDTLDSIFSTTTALGKYVARRAGIGLNAGRIRELGSKIRNGEVEHTGVIPYLKVFEATVRSCTQNGIRGGSATVHFPIWHGEIEDILVLKNNKGTEDNRVRKLDYSIQLSKLFYERYLRDEEITLFSPHEVPELTESFGFPEFDALYVKAEARRGIKKKKVKARVLFEVMLRERAETGRIYIMNIDHCNTHSSFKDRVTMSNLCQEITFPVKPIQHIDDPNGEIGTCILSALNVGALPQWGDKARDQVLDLTRLCVRALEEIIDHQDYPVIAAATFSRGRRAIGVGYTGLAHFLAKNRVKYDDPKAWALVHQLSEAFQFGLIEASVDLASQRGPCPNFAKTKYADGLLPIDHYKKDADEGIDTKLHFDWEGLRVSLKQFGIRHSTLSAQMPVESSSIVSNSTNGIEPPRGFISVKKSKQGPLKQIVPGFPFLKNHYTLLWDQKSNYGYNRIVGVMQKFFDQAISTNWSYNPEHYKTPDDKNEIPMSVLVNDLLTTYKLGHKTAYYHNTFDGKEEDGEEKPQPNFLLQGVLREQDEPDCDSCKI